MSGFWLRTSRGLLAVAVLAIAGQVPADGGIQPGSLVPLVNPVSDKGTAGLFNQIVTARGAEFDSGKAGVHMIRAIEPTGVFSPTAPEIYLVIELKQSAFDMFELIGRFILEDPDGKPVGTLLHTDRAHFEFSDTGGYMMMKQPEGGFLVGSYRIEIHYGEQVNEISLMTLVRFKVVTTAALSSPQP